MAMLEPIELLAAATRENPAIEFFGYDDTSYVIVTRRFADPVDEAALSRFLEELAQTGGVHVELLDKGNLRDTLVVDDAPRRRAQRMHVVKGSVDRSFPDRSRHGDPGAQPLGTLHPSLPTPSQRRLETLARRYHLRRLTIFGSATRADFRPDSDIDLFVEPRPDHRARLGEMVRLNSDAEDLFGRDVDLLIGPIASEEDLFGRDVDLLIGPIAPELAARIERHAVVLYDSVR